MKTIIKVINAFGSKLRDDTVYAFSSNAAFFTIIAFFPFALFLLTLLKYMPFFADGLPTIWENLFPNTVVNVMNLVLSEANPSGTILSITVILALWSASVSMLSIGRGLNKIYGIKETRNYFVVRLFSIFHTLLFIVLLLATMIIFVFGNRLSDWLKARIPEAENIAALVISIRTTAGTGVLFFFFLFLFCTLPNRKAKLLKEIPGAVIASVGWVGFSYLFSFYINNINNYTATYGSLTAVVLCMLWLYFCMFIMFVGAEINSVIFDPVSRRVFIHDRHRQLKKKDREEMKQARKKAKKKEAAK